LSEPLFTVKNAPTSENEHDGGLSTALANQGAPTTMLRTRGQLLVGYLFVMLSCTLSFQQAVFLVRHFGRHTYRSLSFYHSIIKSAASDNETNEATNMEASSLNETNVINKLPQKLHTLTVCMVPPSFAANAWFEITKARTQLKDPGLFRWPPHANLLYPFIEIKDNLENIAQRLRNAISNCQPFQVSLDSLGTFGGNSRGVLWLYPRSYRENDNVIDESYEEPLIQLQALLEQEFPTCTEQRKSGQFTPHMTLSHFASLEDAQTAQAQTEAWWPTNITFDVNQIYLLQRIGDDGQFLRVAAIRLGDAGISAGIDIHSPPEAFPRMPTTEEDWVREERMKLKKQMNGSWKGRRRSRGGRQRSPSNDSRGPISRSIDTPEEIAAKRATRKAKRERLEHERLEKEKNCNEG
jgi:2'-5' RNA ligase